MAQPLPRIDQAARLALGSIAVAAAVLALKVYAWWLTGSVALYSDALESVINVVAAVAALAAVRFGAKPADRNHPYGHHKVEYFSAVLEGALIIVAALAIAREAWITLQNLRPIEAPAAGIVVNAIAAAVNGAWCAVLFRTGRKLRSPALLADARHLLTDVVSSLGVLVGVALVAATGWLVLDPLLAIGVALNILWSGFRLVSESIGGLMDAAPDPQEVERIRGIISAHAEGALEAHDLRTRHAGRAAFVEFHLVVPGKMLVAEAHDICDRIERALKAEMGNAVVTIHVEPENKAKHSGIVVL